MRSRADCFEIWRLLAGSLNAYPFAVAGYLEQKVISNGMKCSFFLLYYCTDGADDGIERIVSSGMILSSFQTRTGIKIVIT